MTGNFGPATGCRRPVPTPLSRVSVIPYSQVKEGGPIKHTYETANTRDCPGELLR